MEAADCSPCHILYLGKRATHTPPQAQPWAGGSQQFLPDSCGAFSILFHPPESRLPPLAPHRGARNKGYAGRCEKGSVGRATEVGEKRR